MQAATAVDEPGCEWNIDVIGPLEPDADGNKYIIALIDSFTRFLVMKPVKGTSAATAARFLFEVTGIFEMPRSIRSDSCSQFTAALITAFLALLGVDRTAAIPYRPQSNGGIERCIKETRIVRHATFIIMELPVRQQHDWSLCLPMVQRMINTAFYSAIGTFPARLLFGEMVTADRCLIPGKLTVGTERVISGIGDKQTTNRYHYIFIAFLGRTCGRDLLWVLMKWHLKMKI
jgi:transposase InsO family protein